MDKAIFLSVIIPSYKNAYILDENVCNLLDHLNSKPYTWEVLIVDDGSNDNGETKQVCLKHNIRYEGYESNKGKGFAVRFGVLKAKGKFVIFTDADIPYSMENLDNMVYYLDFKEFDMVTGDRTLDGSEYFSEISFSRSIGSRLFSFIVGRFITGGQYDTQCGLKGFKSEIANDLFSYSKLNGFIIDVELFYIAFKRNYDVKRIPVVLKGIDGNSVNVVTHGIKMLFDLPKILIYYYSGKYDKQKNR